MNLPQLVRSAMVILTMSGLGCGAAPSEPQHPAEPVPEPSPLVKLSATEYGAPKLGLKFSLDAAADPMGPGGASGDERALRVFPSRDDQVRHKSIFLQAEKEEHNAEADIRDSKMALQDFKLEEQVDFSAGGYAFIYSFTNPSHMVPKGPSAAAHMVPAHKSVAAMVRVKSASKQFSCSIQVGINEEGDLAQARETVKFCSTVIPWAAPAAGAH